MRGTAGARKFSARLKLPRGKLLRGKRSARALGAVRNTDALQRHADSDFSKTKRGREVARTEIVLRLKASATVGQVNAALDSVGGRIAGSLRGSPRLLVAIPDPGSLKVLDKLLAALAKRPGIDDAVAAERASGQDLPPAFASPPSSSRGPSSAICWR